MSMTIDEINAEWSAECDINTNDLVNETARIPRLHNKYYRIYVDSSMIGRVLRSEYDVLIRDKAEYYAGTMDPAEVKRRGWPIVQLRILKTDVQKYVDTDKDVIKLGLKIAARDSATKYLEDIVKQISNRNFQIKNIIDFLKFKNGI